MADSVLTYLDSYCERAGALGVLAEPLNLFSNLLFILAAIFAARSLWATSKNLSSPRRRGSRLLLLLDSWPSWNDKIGVNGSALWKAGQGPRADLWLLVLLLASIGIGSGLWHAVPNATTVLMDVVPITLFINLYILSALRRLFFLAWLKVALWWGLYFAAGMVAQLYLPPDLLNGTIMYIPTYATLAVMTAALLLRQPAIGRVFVCVCAVWSLSLLLRTLDLWLCPSVAIGTHFLWHALNAWVLWRLLQVLMAQARE